MESADPSGQRTAGLPVKSPTYGTAPYNLFAKVMAQFSASYSMPFSENFGDGGKGSSPLLTPPPNGEVRMTLPADGWAGVSGSTTCAGPGGSTYGLTLDGFGGLHGFGGAAVNTASAIYWPNWNIARGMVEISGGTGGHTLDGYGGLHPWGAAPGVTTSAYWSGWDIARRLALNPCDTSGQSGYVLDGLGGMHPFGGAPAVTTSAYWTADLAHGLAMNPCSGSTVTGYVLDNWGGIHGFSSGAAIPNPTASDYWPGWNIARGIAVSKRGRGYVLDGFGGLHPFGSAPARLPSEPWCSGTPMIVASDIVANRPPHVRARFRCGHGWPRAPLARAARLFGGIDRSCAATPLG